MIGNKADCSIHFIILASNILRLTNESDNLHVCLVCFDTGVLRAAAKLLFKSRAEFEVLGVTAKELGDGTFDSHVTFEVTIFDESVSVVKPCSSDIPVDDIATRSVVTSLQLYPDYKTALIGPQVFCNLFPFHVVFDEELTIRQCGANIQKLHPDR